MSTAGAKPRETLNLRIKPERRRLIEEAAALQGKTKTEFILDAASRAAEEAFIDRSVLMVSREAYDAFLERLDEPPAPNERLLKTMAASKPWR